MQPGERSKCTYPSLRHWGMLFNSAAWIVHRLFLSPAAAAWRCNNNFKKTTVRRLIIAQIFRYLFKKKKKSNKHGPIIVPSSRRSFAIEMMKSKCDSSGFTLSQLQMKESESKHGSMSRQVTPRRGRLSFCVFSANEMLGARLIADG